MKSKFLPLPQLIILICSYMLLSACVSSKKYNESVANNEKLTQQNQQLTQQNQDLNNQVSAIKTTYNNYKVECETSKKDCEKSQAELKNIRTVMNEQEEILKQVKAKIYMALADFMEKGVHIDYRDGLLYVRMQDELLFKSGSSTVGEKGKTALGSLARVLTDYPRLAVVVVGHTDSTKFVGKDIDNWTLSTERANGIVRILRDNFKIDPTRLTSAGKAKYDPIASNATADGRAKNRRTEIILKADLDRLWEETAAENK